MRCPPVPGPRGPRWVAAARVAAAALLAVAARAGAQRTPAADPPAATAGARVRVSGASLPAAVIGTLVRATQDTVAVAPERGGAALGLARADIGSFEVSRGRNSRARAVAVWAPVGALLGVAGGFGGVFGYNCPPELTRPQCEDESNRVVGRGVAAGAAVGAVAGAAFGVLFRRRERWQAAPVPVQVGLTLPARHPRRAAGIAVAVRWR